MKKEKDTKVEKIVIKYDNGTEKEITKGLVITDNVNEEQDHNLTFEFAAMGGGDIANIVFGVMQMGEELGLFDDIEEE